jgi:uncharacterized membrane protein
MSVFSDSKNILRTRFISGLLIIVPLILTFVLLRALVEFVDGLLLPIVISVLGLSYDFPFIGVIVTAVLILLAGIFAANVMGRRFIKIWEFLIFKIPIVNFFYGSAKQLVQALAIPQNKSFKSVVAVEYPRKGIYTLGFLANETKFTNGNNQSKFLNVFIPSTPTPISGLVVLFPPEDVTYLDMSIEDGIKFFVSGSIISPGFINTKTQNSTAKKNECDDKLLKAELANEIK